MYLNVDIVFDNLPPEMNARIAGPKVLDLVLRRPKLYEGGGAAFEANRLYLVSSDRVPQRAHTEHGCVIVCIGETPLLERYRKSCSVIVIERDADFYQAFNVLQRIFDGYDKWETELREIIDRSGNVGQLLTCSEPVFGSSLFAIDEDFKILGVSGGTAATPTGKGPSGGKTLGIDVVDQFLELHDLSMDEREPLVLTLLDQTTLNYNLFESDVYRGCLTVLYEGRPYRPSDKPLIEQLGRFVLIAKQQLAARAPEGLGSLRQAVQALVEERPLDSVERDVVAAVNDGRSFVCIRLKLSNQLEQLPLGFVRNAIEETFPSGIVFEYHRNSVVALLDVGKDDGKGFRATIEEGLGPFVNAMAMDAGVSNPYNDLLVAKSLFFQANQALDIGLFFEPAKRLHFFEDYALRALVMGSVSDMRLELHYPEGLRRLVEHDDVSTTSYVETLRVYLENNQSIAKTSSDLYVHRSTLMERLMRIKRELGLDLDDPDVQLRLRIILKAMQSRSELRSAQERNQS